MMTIVVCELPQPNSLFMYFLLIVTFCENLVKIG